MIEIHKETFDYEGVEYEIVVFQDGHNFFCEAFYGGTEKVRFQYSWDSFKVHEMEKQGIPYDPISEAVEIVKENIRMRYRHQGFGM